jgi:PAS domain-containing protein
MRIDIKKLSLLHQTYLLFGGFLLLAIINYYLITNAKDNITNFGSQIVEIQHSKERIEVIKSYSQQVMNNNELAKNNLEAEILSLDNFLITFENGGLLTSSETEINAGSEQLKKIIQSAKPFWLELKENYSIINYEPHKIDTVVQVAVMVVLDDSTTTTEIQTKTLSINNEIVKKASNNIKLHQNKLSSLISDIEKTVKMGQIEADNWLDFILVFFLAFNIICIVIVVLVIRKKVFVPINNVGEILLSNDFNRKSEYFQNNEIGIISSCYNGLALSQQRATAFVTKIAEGKIDEKIEGLDESKIKEGSLEWALLNMREQMKRMDNEESERTWTTEGLAKFVDILRASDNVQELGDAIISNLVDYSKANQGGIYIINEEDPNNRYLELISLYAYSQKKFDQKKYRLGEGLVGQTFLEKKTIYLFELPEDYIGISSGLGGANPKTILLVPLKIENEIYGVIEIASFYEFEEYQISFVEKLGESIASTIAAVKANQKTKQLLEESQQLTEQMQAQEEEMRQNMEELSATQEEMSRKELAVVAQLDVINNSLGTAEYGLNGEVLTANLKFYDALGYDYNSILQSSYYSLHDDADLFNELQQGKSWAGWLDKHHKEGTTVRFKSTLSPIYDESGDVIKIIELIVQFERENEHINEVYQLDDLKEVEEELRQNLEELEITQEQLNSRLIASDKLLDAFKEFNRIVTIDESGEILELNKKVIALIGQDHVNIDTIFENSLNDILQEGMKKSLLLLTDNPQKIEASVFIQHIINNHKRISIIW